MIVEGLDDDVVVGGGAVVGDEVDVVVDDGALVVVELVAGALVDVVPVLPRSAWRWQPSPAVARRGAVVAR